MKRFIVAAAVLLASASVFAQSSKFVSFFSAAESLGVAYYVDSPSTDADFADLYTINQDGVASLLEPASRTADGKRVVLIYSGLTYRNAHRFGNEFRLFLPLGKYVDGITVSDLAASDARKDFVPLEQPYPDAPIVIKNLSALGDPLSVRPAQAPVNRLEMAFDTRVVDASCEKTKGALVTYTVKAGESVEDVIRNIRTAAGLNQSENYPSVRQRRDRRLYEWNDRHAAILAYNARVKPNVVLIGDSITHYWGDQAGCYLDFGREYFDALFEGWRTTNLGYGWDRIENMMWRLDHGEMDGYKAEHVFIMAGTNNVYGKMTDEKCAQLGAGVADMVRYIRAKQPKARIHVVKIYPRTGVEDRLTLVNSSIVEGVKDIPGVDIVDCWGVLADENGKAIPSLFTDGCHPNTAGYKLIAEVYREYLK